MIVLFCFQLVGQSRGELCQNGWTDRDVAQQKILEDRKFSVQKFRGPKWCYFVNFRCTGPRCIYRGPDPEAFSLTSLKGDPALLLTCGQQTRLIRFQGQTSCRNYHRIFSSPRSLVNRFRLPDIGMSDSQLSFRPRLPLQFLSSFVDIRPLISQTRSSDPPKVRHRIGLMSNWQNSLRHLSHSSLNSRAPARFQARVGKPFWRKFGATNFFSLPTLDLITRVGKDPPAITQA